LVKTGSITIGLQSSEIAGGRQASALEGASSIFITIQDSKNNIVIDKEISLIKLNNAYLTETIVLKEGDYKVTRFLVLDENDNAIYATPAQGSRDAHLVDQTLPLPFTIHHDNATSLPLQVISLKFRTANDIGYVFFQIIRKCVVSATADSQDLCFDDSRYLIAYASVPGQTSVFSLSTSYTNNGTKGFCQIVVETTEFTGPGTYAIREYDGGPEYSTYGNFFNLDTTRKQATGYNSVSGTLVVESVKQIKGTSNGLATGTFTMTVKDDQGNSIEVKGSFNNLRGMGWWE
jgi:hypothetical protein